MRLLLIAAAALLTSCAARPEFTQLGADRYKVTVPLGRSQEAARRKAEDAANRKCRSNQYARFYDYIDALGTPGRYSAYFECLYMGDLTE